VSDLITKKSLLFQLLTRPGGSARSNADIAAEAGCQPSTVRKAREQLETELLRHRVAELEGQLAEQKAKCLCHDVAEKRDAVKSRRRKQREESYPLFVEEHAVAEHALEPVGA